MNIQADIPAGLVFLPRQIGLFPEFRNLMLAAIADQGALAGWRARRQDDFGVMLLEMWAYCCDVLAFYDETIAHECYVRTARQRASLRRLVGLLGYLPSPALAASVELAILAEGRKPLTLAAGTAFRSAAFPGGSPQIFETAESATVYPQNNQWEVERPAAISLYCSGQTLLLDPKHASLSAGDRILLQKGLQTLHADRVKAVSKIQGRDEAAYLQVELETLMPGISGERGSLKLKKTVRSATLWNLPHVGTDPNPVNVYYTELVLNGVYPDLQAGAPILVDCGGELRWFIASQVETVMMQPQELDDTSMTQSNNDVTYTFTPPAIKIPATKIKLDVSLNFSERRRGNPDWTTAMANKMTVHYFLHDAGTVVVEASPVLESGDPLKLAGTDEIITDTSRFLLEDADQTGAAVSGYVDPNNRQLHLDQGEGWEGALAAPVTAFGNVVSATRGESVAGEVLGSGDASQASQSFKLKKKPLTYVAANLGDSGQGASSTLQLYVNNVLWQEVPTFYGQGPQDQVYIVRHNDDEEAVITCGDGVRGARFPTGSGNVAAYYRFGAGAAAPPAGGITQPAKPVKDLKSVRNPVAAAPGSDAQGAENIRTYAPQSALLLGRAVSIQDFEAAAAGVSGVRAVQGQWRWHEQRQQPVVQIWIIGPDTVREKVRQSLHALSDPSVPIEVEMAQRLPRALNIDVACDPNLEDKVIADIQAALMNAENGLLAPEHIGIGQPLFRSRLFDAVLEVEGAESVTGLLWEGSPWIEFRPEKPTPGCYYDFEQGGLTINAQRRQAQFQGQQHEVQAGGGHLWLL